MRQKCSSHEQFNKKKIGFEKKALDFNNEKDQSSWGAWEKKNNCV